MSLQTNVTDLATRIATEFKAIRVLISGTGTGNTSGLLTTSTNLVGAINEVLAATGGPSTLAGQTDVTITSPTTGQTLRWNGTVWVNYTLTKSDVGLANVDNTSDANKPVSTAVQTALNGKQDQDADLTAIAALTTTSYGRSLLTLANQAALNTAIADATETASGTIEIATQTETNTGTDDARAVTPLKLQTRMAAYAQPLDSDLTAIAALTTTSYGRAFLELANQSGLMSLIQAGSETVQGKLELATNAETVTGTDTVRATHAAGTKAAIDARIDNNAALGSSTVNAPSQAAVKAYADALIASNDAMVFKGVIDASANPNYPAANRGDTYRISVAGRIGGASGINVEIGDLVICTTDGSASGTQASVGANWTIVQSNLDGVVIGPASSTDSNFALFNGSTGKAIKDSGITLSTSTALGTSNTAVPTQNAVKTYADTKQPLDATLTAFAGLTTAANQVAYSTGSDAFAMSPLTAFGRSLIDDNDAAAARTTLSVYSQAEIGNPETNFVTVFEAALA